MQAFQSILKFVFFAILFSIFPIWIATSFGLNVDAFIITFDFVLLMFILADRKHKKGGKSTNDSKIQFHFPFYDEDYK